MATSEGSAESGALSFGSHDTALCLIPPQDLWPSIERIRALYDKGYGRWPPHVNLAYPFVQPDSLPRAARLIESGLQRRQKEVVHAEARPRISIDAADVFRHKADNTLFRCDSDEERTSTLIAFRRSILELLGHGDSNSRLHMTVAQSEDANSDPHKFLLDKISRMPSLGWDIEQISILVRERVQLDGSATSQMKLWGIIDLSTGSVTRLERPRVFYEAGGMAALSSTVEESGERDQLQTRSPYYFDEETELWVPFSPSEMDAPEPPQRFVVSSYNVLGEFHWPPSHDRYPLVIKNILSKQASADVLVIQEATDDFLSYLLKDERVRDLYPFTSHGPPDQADIEPLPSLLNLVVLSKWAFDWEWVSFRQKHKGSVVAKFKDIGKRKGDTSLPTVLATVHLTCGLTDGAIISKKIDIQKILKYLSKSYPDNPWILTGDFNISTSSFSIDAALRKKAMSTQSLAYLTSFEQMFTDARLADAWSVSRFEIGDASDGEVQERTIDELVEGERGATYDPTINEVAASIVGAGYNMRPQRYDRILVRGEDAFVIAHFNKFGFLKERINQDDPDAGASYASDHWGVRCIMKVGSGETERLSDQVSNLVVPVHLKTAPGGLSGDGTVKDCLADFNIIPSEAEFEKRQAVFNLLKRVLLEDPAGDSTDNNAAYHKSRASVIVVPVGSYGLGVWTTSSDIDCLCIGPFSSQTFFALAAQRLRKAASEGVRVLRRVRANTGTMLELEIQGIKIDLQYCPATSIAENWPYALKAPPSDPVWSLPIQTLSKLKAIRDLDYLRRSIPDIAKFRTAYRFIRAWAQSRGIFSARFGFLGGVHLSILLVRVCKFLARDAGSPVSVPDILATFFSHYASFNWRESLVFDPFFHRHRLQYTRTAREPLAILGFFPPALNTAHAASAPSVRTLAEEFKRADALIRSADHDSTWAGFLRGNPSPPATTAISSGGAPDFLRAYKTYIRIDVQYWGQSLSKCIQLAGWLESRCVMLLVDLHRRLPAIHARIWPERFVEAAAAAATSVAAEEEGEDASRNYSGYYLVGLDRADDRTGGTEQVKAAAEGELRAVLGRFEEQIRGEERYYDERTCWVGVDLVGRAKLAGLVVDERDWGEYTPGEEEEDEESDEEDQEGELDEGGIDGLNIEDDGPAKKKNKKKERRAAQAAAAASPSTAPHSSEPGKKLRTAADVLNRLRWDPALDSGDYIVGYLDRFVGCREKALDAWRTEQTDEEFIPQHRIRYFKRKTDGAVVWERETKQDDIFGSGAER